jgi:signal transduction histidine kinase
MNDPLSTIDFTGEQRRLQVLALEDSADDVELLEQHLRNDGHSVHLYRVDTLASFAGALEAEPWDAVLADYNLVGFTALDALAVVKAKDIDVPFIVVSGSIGEESAVSAMRAGAHDFFLKGRVARLGVAMERERREAAMRRERRQAIAERERLMGDLRLALKVRDEFLAVASHELLTPLTPLELQIDAARLMLRRSSAGGPNATVDRLAPMLEGALGHVHRMTKVANTLLDVTRVNSGRFELRRREIELGEIVRQVVAGAYETLQRSGSPLVIVAPSPVRGCWDALAIQTAIGNLLSNAIKFGCGRPIEILVNRERDIAQVSVTDAGIGIPAEALTRIFERFERAVPLENYGGLGLGLWMTKQITEAHGGRVHVESWPGLGSTFTVELRIRSV